MNNQDKKQLYEVTNCEIHNKPVISVAGCEDCIKDKGLTDLDLFKIAVGNLHDKIIKMFD